MKRARTVAAVVAGAVVAAAVMMGGPTSPPPGPVTSQYKTLTEVEPRTAINATNTPGDADSLFKITQRGSYYLMGNITGFAGKHGIEIAVSGVTLDLNGFDLAGITKMGLVDGVSVTVASLTNIAVVNGSVRNWGDEGVDLGTLNATNCRVEGVRASGNGGIGINTGDACTVSHCAVYQNANNGISTGDACTVSHCAVYQNASNGIRTGDGCTIANCAAYGNTFVGIFTGFGTTVSNCSAYDNSSGIRTSTGSTVTACTANLNSTFGIDAGGNCTVADCSTRANGRDGITCSSGSLIRGNTCGENGSGAGDGAGILAVGIDSRIEGNNCTGADRGIDVDSAGNIIIRNTCSGNTTNWAIAANNYYGPIIDRTGVATAAVNGSVAAGTLATADPNANFSY